MKRPSASPMVTSLLCLWGVFAIEPCLGQEASKTTDGVIVQDDTQSGIIRVKIPAQEGKVAWEDVLRALLRAGKLEDNALKDSFPSGSLDLERAYSQYALLAINVTLAPDIRMEIIPKTQREPAYLLVTANKDALQEKGRRISKKIRKRLVGEELREGEFGLRLKPGWEQAAAGLPLVVVVHGFNSSPQRFEPLANALREAGLPSATYSYPDDQPIDDSAEQLAADLKKLAKDFPQRSVALVTHSMGGLVARSVIEQPDLDAGNVKKLIMVAPPTHGSLLAYFAFGIDIIDQIVDTDRSNEVTRFYAAVEDGLSEAKNDLKPNSPFLRRLSARARNPQVHYSIILGTGGHLNEVQVNRLRDGLQLAKNESKVVGLFAPQLDETLADLEEVIRGKGDGVVAVKRGRLEGVTDTLLADFSHLGVLQTTGSFADDEVFQAVLARLKP